MKSSDLRLTSPVSGHGKDQRLKSLDMRSTSPISGPTSEVFRLEINISTVSGHWRDQGHMRDRRLFL